MAKRVNFYKPLPLPLDEPKQRREPDAHPCERCGQWGSHGFRRVGTGETPRWFCRSHRHWGEAILNGDLA